MQASPLPSAAKLPYGHGVQVARVTAPIAVENVPNGHFRHATASINGEYVPGAHWVQLLPWVPLGQCLGGRRKSAVGLGGNRPTHSYTDAAATPVL